MTFVASSNAALYLGATPVFAEIISLENPTISPADISRRINSRTKAIIAMHYGGYPCEIEEIARIARKHSVTLIEDAAHAPMVKCNGKMLGTFGDAGCFSFYANKNMTTAEGGMIITDDAKIAEQAQRNRSHGISHLAHERFTAGTVGYNVVDLGYNYRIDEIRSAIGIIQLRRLKKAKSARKKAVEQYQRMLKDIPNVIIPFVRYKGDSAYHLFGVVLGSKSGRRNRIIEEMRAARVQVSNHYTPVHLFEYYRRRFRAHKGMLPVTEEYGRNQITLPLYNGIKEEDIEYVVFSLEKAIRK
jgi:dTDP-4-amino-4,6-dideoxygalactose transaminase